MLDMTFLYTHKHHFHKQLIPTILNCVITSCWFTEKIHNYWYQQKNANVRTKSLIVYHRK